MMLNEQLILELRCELEQLITLREGMIAENTIRERCGESLAYTERYFTSVHNDIRKLREKIIQFGKK